MAQSEFKTVYFVPRLESDLEFVHHHIKNKTEEEKRAVEYRLTTIRNELEKETSSIAGADFPHMDELYYDHFTSKVSSVK